MELEEENRLKLAEATLAELAHREDLSDSNTDVTEPCLSSSKEKETERINDCINNSPNGADASALPTSSSNNAVTVIAPQQLVENGSGSQAGSHNTSRSQSCLCPSH